METVLLHSRTKHVNRVNSSCRLCGERVKRAKKDKKPCAKLCVSYVKEISDFHCVDILQDTEGKHAKLMCVKCYTRLVKLKHSNRPCAGTRENACHATTNSAHLWCNFDPTLSADQCKLCCHFNQQCKGGKPSKRKRDSSQRQSFLVRQSRALFLPSASWHLTDKDKLV